MGIFVRCFLILLGLLLFGMSLNSLARRKLEASFTVSWGFVALFLIVAAVVLKPERWEAVLGWTTLCFLSAALLLLLHAGYRITLHLSKLANNCNELATQVSLLQEEELRRKAGKTVPGAAESGKELLIIIPAYNEEKNLGAVLDSVLTPELRPLADVLVIDDSSADRTRSVALAHGAACVRHVFNLGYGSGLKLGYQYAVRNGYRYVIQMDADGQHDAVNVPLILKELKDGAEGERPDLVLGCRYMEGSGAYDCGFLRRIAYAWFRQIIRMMTGVKIADPTTGLQGLSRKAAEFYSRYLHFDARFPDSNMLVQMLLLGFRLRQIPAVMHYRTEGTSIHAGLLNNARYMIRMTLQLFAVWLRIRVKGMDKAEAQRLLLEPEDTAR